MKGLVWVYVDWWGFGVGVGGLHSRRQGCVQSAWSQWLSYSQGLQARRESFRLWGTEGRWSDYWWLIIHRLNSLQCFFLLRIDFGNSNDSTFFAVFLPDVKFKLILVYRSSVVFEELIITIFRVLFKFKWWSCFPSSHVSFWNYYSVNNMIQLLEHLL